MNHQLLLNEFQLNPFLTLKNRIVMAPMTRVKATADLIPTEAMADYYARRAQAGLIITEGAVVSPDALGNKNVPGIFSDLQVLSWRRITEKVHAQGGLIFMQLWHVGRVSHPDLLSGKLPVSASETVMTGRLYREQGLMHGKSRAATRNEIQEIIHSYASAAKNAIKAGFDGIEIHGANGYLIDQFLHYHTNQRQDDYGGSPENMARLALEIINACGQAIGYERMGVRLSPGAYLNQILGDVRDSQVFAYLLEKLNSIPIAYVHTGNMDDTQVFKELYDLTMTDFMRQHYKGKLIANGGYTFESAINGINNKQFDLIAFGRPFIANHDLVYRFVNHKKMNKYDVSMLNTLY